MPEPRSKSHAAQRAQRARRRKEAEKTGMPVQHADELAKKALEEEEEWRPPVPHTERDRGPLGEREEQREDQREGERRRERSEGRR